MRTNDILITAFPRSGITFLGFLLTAARLHLNRIPLVPTFYNIDFLLIDRHKMANLMPGPSIWKDGIGDLFKYHGNNVPGQSIFPNVIYLLRNPVDALSSYYQFRQRLGVTESVDDFLNGPHGIGAWNTHVHSWLLDNANVTQSIHVVQYEELQVHPHNELEKLGRNLGWSLNDDSINAGVRASSLESMRRNEQDFARRNPVYARRQLEFVRPHSDREVPEFTLDHIQTVRRETRATYEQVLTQVEMP